MSEQYLRTGQRSGCRGLWFALGGIVTAAVAILAVGPGGGEARAQQENLTFDEVLDRVEEARARIESVSYRFVRSTERFDGSPDHMHQTIDVLERGDLRRMRRQQQLVMVGDPDHVREIHGAAVLNDHALAIRTGPVIHEPVEVEFAGQIVQVEPRARTDVWDLGVIDVEEVGVVGNAMWLRFDPEIGDLLRYGFGTVHGVVSALRPLADPDPELIAQVPVRVFQRGGREQIELRTPDHDDWPGTFASYIIEPERGYLITHIRQHVRGVVTLEQRVEPVLIEDETGESIWFPGSAEVTTWHLGEDGERSLRMHSIIRFEDVRINLPVPDQALSLPVALEWQEGHSVRIWDEERPREKAWYRDGELVDVRPTR